MNLKSVPKQTLLFETERLVRDERRITTAILWHLHEIDRRRLFAELGFASLFEYCTEQLKYSAGGAQRRIASMRLLRELPEIEAKINSGELNVSAVAQAQSVFRQAKRENKAFTLEAKKEIVERLENKSHRDCEKILAEINPTSVRPSRERVISASRTEIRFEASDELYEKIQKLKGFYAHRLKGSSNFADLIELLVTQALEKHDAKAQSQSQSQSQSSSGARQPLPTSEVTVTNRYIPQAIRKNAMAKAQGRCTYVDPKSRRRCSSTFALEFDHIIPLGRGGLTIARNIRVLCRTHNQLAAVQNFGARKMEGYLFNLKS